MGDVYFRAADHQLVRPVVIVQGKKPGDMKNPEDYWEVLEVVPGAPLDAGAGRVRLQTRRLYLIVVLSDGQAAISAACRASPNRRTA